MSKRGQVEVTLKLTPYEAQRLSVLLGEVAEDHRWQAEMLDSVGTQMSEQIDVVAGRPPVHSGYRWIGYGLPRPGQWYDDDGEFEEADDSWTDENHRVNVYESTQD